MQNLAQALRSSGGAWSMPPSTLSKGNSPRFLPSFGRWLTPDPSGFTDGMNLYAYVHNNPLTHQDEYGLLTYVHGQGWQNCPWGSPFSYSSSHLGSNFFAKPPEKWNLSQVDPR